MTKLNKDQRRKKKLDKKRKKKLEGARKAKVKVFGVREALTDAQQRALGMKVPDMIETTVKPGDDEGWEKVPTEFMTGKE